MNKLTPEVLAVSLCDYTGNMLRPWAQAGCECWAVDVQHSIRRDREEGGIRYVWGDVRSWAPPRRPTILFAFPPCTHLAVSGARDWNKKSWPMLRDGMDLFHACYQAAIWSGAPYMIENPVGRLSGIHGEADHTFDPYEYGADYQKRTCLWTGQGFVMPPPFCFEKPNHCTQKIWLMPPGEDRQNLRSATPPEFAQAVFDSNKHLICKH